MTSPISPVRTIALTRSLLFIALAFLSACGGEASPGTSPGGGGTTTVAVGSVSVSPNTAIVTVGASTTLTATTLSSAGATLTGRTVSWTSSNNAVATVTSTGVVTGVSSGTSTVSAVSEGITGTATITVPAQVVASIAFVNAPTTATVGTATNLVVQAKDASGAVIANEPVVWSTSNGRVATTATTGTFTSCATTEGATCTFTGTKLVRYGKDAAFFNMFGSGSIVCSSTVFGGDPLPNVAKGCSFADLLQTTGSLVLRPVGAGTVVVTARSVNNSALTATASLTVAGGVIAKYNLNTTFCSTCTLAGVTLAVGGSTSPTIYPTDDADNILNLPITATSNNTAVATVSLFTTSQYTVQAVANGTATITFAPGTGATGASNSFLVTVGAAAAPVSTVTLVANAPSISVGQTTQVTATLKDASNNTLTGRTITYTSSAPTVASVSATGLVTALAAGSTTITATSETKTGTANITVTAAAPVPVATVTLTAASNALTVPNTTQLTVVTKDGSGNTLTGRTVTYASATPGVATVSATGLVTAVAAGTSTITATSEGINGTTVITVTAAAPAARLAFALVNGATNAIDPAFSFNGSGGAITVTSLGTGRWHVVFAGLGRTAGQSDFARVTPQKDVVCSFENYGQDVNVANAYIDVNCQAIGVTFASTNSASFSVMFVGNGVLTGRTGFLKADQATTSTYVPDANFASNSANAAMSATRTLTGSYQNVQGIFPRGTATPEVPLIGTFFDASFYPVCESEGIEVFTGTRSFVECRSGNQFSAQVDARYNQLIFSGGRSGAAWGFGYYTQGSTDISLYQKTSDNSAVTFASNGAGGRVATISSLGGTSPVAIQIMPNFNGNAGRWTTCGYGAIDRTAKTVEVVCRDRTNTIVPSDFVVVTFQ